MSLGYPLKQWKKFLLKGNLAYTNLSWKVEDTPWKDVFSVEDDLQDKPFEFNMTKLEFLFEISFLP